MTGRIGGILVVPGSDSICFTGLLIVLTYSAGVPELSGVDSAKRKGFSVKITALSVNGLGVVMTEAAVLLTLPGGGGGRVGRLLGFFLFMFNYF